MEGVEIIYSFLFLTLYLVFFYFRNFAWLGGGWDVRGIFGCLLWDSLYFDIEQGCGAGDDELGSCVTKIRKNSLLSLLFAKSKFVFS
jgi:hypothetical protein